MKRTASDRFEGHATEIAQELLTEAKARGYELALFMLPNGEFGIAPAYSPRADVFLRAYPDSLVGVYDGTASIADIVQDIAAQGFVSA